MLYFALWFGHVHVALASHKGGVSDRFAGWRFEIFDVDSLRANAIKNSLRDKADELFCFGWAQESAKHSIVGEVRCEKDRDTKMKAHLSLLAELSSSKNETIAVRDYPDTLIRLHFSHFKLFSDERNTCFPDEPHKCERLYDETEDGVKFRDR